MSEMLGADLSSVRVHTDPSAAEAASMMRADAFTVGSDIYFGAHRYQPGTPGGERLLAHELVHTLQRPAPTSGTRYAVSRPTDHSEREAETVARSATGAASRCREPSGFSTPVAPDRRPPAVVARRSATVQRQQTVSPEAGPRTVGEEIQEALAEYETNWAQISPIGIEFSELAGWLSAGETVLGLMREHRSVAAAAAVELDPLLFSAARKALESDAEMYEFVAWHLVAYASLLGLDAHIEDIADSLDHDDRAFSGRDEAERLVAMFQEQIAKVPEHSEVDLDLFQGDVPLAVRPGQATEVVLRVTSVLIPGMRPTIAAQTSGMVTVQVNVQKGVSALNTFLATARREGVVQTWEAIQEFVAVRGRGTGRGPKIGKLAKKRRPSRKKKGKQDSSAAADKLRRETRTLLLSPWLRVGPFAGGSVATGNRYIANVTTHERRQVSALGARFGDHHTGARVPGASDWIPDHQPVTRLVEMAHQDPELHTMMTRLRMSTTLARQRLYPHSQTSSWSQGGTVRAIQSKLAVLAGFKRRKR